jgi:hypothetical protein
MSEDNKDLKWEECKNCYRRFPVKKEGGATGYCPTCSSIPRIAIKILRGEK